MTLAQHHPWARPVSAAMVDEIRREQSFDFYRARFADASGFTFLSGGHLRPRFDPPPGADVTWATCRARGAADRARDRGIRPARRRGGADGTQGDRGQEPDDAGVQRARPTATREERFALDALGRDSGYPAPRGAARRAGRHLQRQGERARSPGFPSGIQRVDQLRLGAGPGRCAGAGGLCPDRHPARPAGPRATDLAKVKETSIRTRETNLRQNGWWLGQCWRRGARATRWPTGLALEPQLARLTPEVIRDAARTLSRPDAIRPGDAASGREDAMRTSRCAGTLFLTQGRNTQGAGRNAEGRNGCDRRVSIRSLRRGAGPPRRAARSGWTTAVSRCFGAPTAWRISRPAHPGPWARSRRAARSPSSSPPRRSCSWRGTASSRWTTISPSGSRR